MFTTLVIVVTAIVAYKYGKKRGEEEAHLIFRGAERNKQEFFSRISLN
jgi:hypothetical protein